MKKFEFHLESALRLRNTQLQAEQLKLQRLIAEEQRLRNSLLALTTEQNAARTAFHTSASVAAADLRALRRMEPRTRSSTRDTSPRGLDLGSYPALAQAAKLAA